ncbi:hypothetical protein GCM10012288_11380 [Malaciobacter pacificus]|uniref:Putative membrane protein n=1 Tax=Malaciobacter pacificus TaxID=1080223 RepID=A0A5C2HBD9_9BACT|nr:hypothetical protein [Malaciobacter pacificus]QEP33582.1 putative membrane protein [Malaciobacter pacificus]GGD39077.1 hypothetical protein GCM10012288_11380 [Malaciobacter pacificus]
MNTSSNNKNLFRKIKYKFDFVTSNHGKNWLLALNWIFIFELISSILEYNLVEKAQNFVEPITNTLFKEISIAILLVLFIWYSLYNFIFMNKERFLLFTIYIWVCIYFLFTNDLTFNLLLHNLNPTELYIDGFGIYLVVQVLLKVIILYLIYKLLIAFKNRKSNT